MSKTLRSFCLKLFLTLFLTLLLLGIPKLAGAIANGFDYGAMDPDGAFAWLFVHHLAQAAIFLVIIMVIRRFRPLDFGLSWGNEAIGKAYVLRFTWIFSLYMVASYILILMTKSFQPFPYPLIPRNIVGYLGFQLLGSGPSEELIFRAFAITMLGLVLKGRVFSSKVSLTNIVATVIFGLAHVSFSFAPFQVSYSPMQVLFAMGLGLFYGDCYEKSGSVFYPMMMHSIGNVLSVGATVLLTFLAQ